jgi:hypothetical protein
MANTTTIAADTFPEWSGSQDPEDPDNLWVDDVTGERVCALDGSRATLREIAMTPAEAAQFYLTYVHDQVKPDRIMADEFVSALRVLRELGVNRLDREALTDLIAA